MTRLDYTPALVATLKGQALRDAFESLAGFEPPQTKGDAALRKLVLAKIDERDAAASADDKPAKKSRKAKAPIVAVKKPRLKKAKPTPMMAPDHEEQAEVAEVEGRWADAAILWTAAAEGTQVETKRERFIDRAAAARIRAEEHVAPQTAAGTATLVHVAEALAETPAVEPEAAPVAETIAPVSAEVVLVEQPAEVQAPVVEQVAAAPVASTKRARKARASKQPTVAPTANVEATAPLTTAAALPAIGTVIQKKDRDGKVRCECTVVDGGIQYAGKLYGSLSGAGLAATHDLGLKAPTCDGGVFWGLKKRPAKGTTTRQPKPAKSTTDAIGKAWSRYVAALMAGGMTAEKVARAEAHTDQLIAIRAGHAAEHGVTIQ